MKKIRLELGLTAIVALMTFSCKSKQAKISPDIGEIDLKRGELVQCGPADKQFGKVDFDVSCPEKIKADFNLAISLLHSFEYDEAEKVFAKIIDAEPQCAMAYWGVAMSNYHALWTPPTQAELEKGAKATSIARSIPQKTERESAYIDAIASFYEDWNKTDHRTRSVEFRKQMEKVYSGFPEDKEAALFYALSLDAAADPFDTSFTDQRKAGAILEKLYADDPNHPGIIHYIIHSYDYPGIATLALPAAKKYAAIAPSSAHAQHMPSHIFIRLGLWNEAISSNLVAASAAKCYAEGSGIKGHWDEELHCLDYLVYGYLQRGENKLAKEQWDYLKTIFDVSPLNFKVAYAFAAIPARYVLENRKWEEASNLQLHPAKLAWDKFPWQKAIFHFARVLGFVHTGRLEAARSELNALNIIRDTLLNQKDNYKANQVDIQIKASQAWIKFKEGKTDEALKLMVAAADMEDKTEKHPVTPGEVIPARELLGDMFLAIHQYEKALDAFEADLKTHPGRFNGLYGAGFSAQKLNDKEKASLYFQQLIDITSGEERIESKEVRQFLATPISARR